MTFKNFFLKLEENIKIANSNANENAVFSHTINHDLIELVPLSIAESVFYFKAKDENHEILGLGKSRVFKNETEAQEHLQKNPSLIYCAPLRFDTEFENIFLPEITLSKKDNEVSVILSKTPDEKNFATLNLFFDLNTPCAEGISFSNWATAEDLPDYSSWETMIEQAKELIKNKSLKKIVLSRRKAFTFNFPLMPIDFFIKSLRSNSVNNNCYALFYQENFSNAFISLSPETLYKKQEDKIQTMSLAGSTPRGKNKVQDSEGENFLQEDPKLIQEQSIVTNQIAEDLNDICEDVAILENQTLKLSYIQHRLNKITGRLKSHIQDKDILKALHPTPAVGGLPKLNISKIIRTIENYDRNNYAGAFGYFSEKKSEFAVAIRAAQIKKNCLFFFGGAGILELSDPQSEWEETGLKMTPFLKVIEHD